MGTRADFYVGRGEQAEWLGSIAFDGYPDGNVADPKFGPIIGITDEAIYRKQVSALIADLNHGTTPEHGWPWPWEDSRTTDYAYALAGGKVWASCFGHEWFDPHGEQPEKEGQKTAFPNMKDRQKVTLGERSGIIVVVGGG